MARRPQKAVSAYGEERVAALEAALAEAKELAGVSTDQDALLRLVACYDAMGPAFENGRAGARGDSTVALLRRPEVANAVSAVRHDHPGMGLADAISVVASAYTGWRPGDGEGAGREEVVDGPA